jgi:hypothetical protein
MYLMYPMCPPCAISLDLWDSQPCPAWRLATPPVTIPLSTIHAPRSTAKGAVPEPRGPACPGIGWTKSQDLARRLPGTMRRLENRRNCSGRAAGLERHGTHKKVSHTQNTLLLLAGGSWGAGRKLSGETASLPKMLLHSPVWGVLQPVRNVYTVQTGTTQWRYACTSWASTSLGRVLGAGVVFFVAGPVYN